MADVTQPGDDTDSREFKAPLGVGTVGNYVNLWGLLN
jgi:hypothetical protein